MSARAKQEYVQAIFDRYRGAAPGEADHLDEYRGVTDHRPQALGARGAVVSQRIDGMKQLASRLTWWHMMLPHKSTPRSTPQREEASHALGHEGSVADPHQPFVFRVKR